MDLKKWDALEAEIAEMVLSGSLPFNKAIGAVAQRYPEENVRILVLASISFCSSIDQFFGLAAYNDLLSSNKRYETLAALSVDIAVMPEQSQTFACLVGYWTRTNDGMFLA
ncbi:hypothetical protein [Sulfitobacter sp.]|uniref:hypothetical protein n=1 Tax=Sulfitobacter sp. TaxID=1903071 RepID=UPI00300385BC